MHDAIVIGTGPAGGLAALRLAEAGARVLVLERKTLPRDKACGGAITATPVRALLDWDFSSQVAAKVDVTRTQLNHGRARESRRDGAAWLVNRRTFDAHIVERALERGRGAVTLRDGFAVARVEEDEDAVTVVGKTGERLRARYLVGADGAGGRTAPSLGLGRRTKPGIAVDAEVHVSPEAWASEAGRMSFNFACVPGGYGWIFPKDGHLSCGVGSWTSSTGMPQALDAYLARALPPGSIRSQKRLGHPIPIYEGPARISTRRVCLVGDAANLVEPILGEGIRFALESGAIAAAVIGEALAGADLPEDGLEHTRRVHAAMGAAFERLRRFILPIFIKSPDTFFRNFHEQGQSYFALARALDARFSGAPAELAPAAATQRSAQS